MNNTFFYYASNYLLFTSILMSKFLSKIYEKNVYVRFTSNYSTPMIICIGSGTEIRTEELLSRVYAVTSVDCENIPASVPI
jgi:hypothetical protein